MLVVPEVGVTETRSDSGLCISERFGDIGDMVNSEQCAAVLLLLHHTISERRW